MTKKYKMRDIPVEDLIKQAKAWGLTFGKDTIYLQLLVLKEKNRKISNFILLKKFNDILNTYKKYENEIVFYQELLNELNKIPLIDLEEYCALKQFLEGVSDQEK